MPKMIDLKGQRFGKLLVLSLGTKKPNGEYTWLCQCDCGKQVEIRGYSLRSGKTTSCGCNASSRNLNLIGKQVNNLTVKEKTNERDSSGCILWLCQCKCGKYIKVPTAKLKANKIQSCGCERLKNTIEANKKRKKDLKGQIFGRLIVLEELEERSIDKQVQWLCQCECGQIIKVRSGDLRSGNTKSCGCGRQHSYGEEKIEHILKNNNIIYEKEKSFQTCRFEQTNHLARFDFYLPQFNTLIEYDGRQHFIEGKGNFDNPKKFADTQIRDNIKTTWCKENNIPLIRIPYTHLDDICLSDLLPGTSTFLI